MTISLHLIHGGQRVTKYPLTIIVLKKQVHLKSIYIRMCVCMCRGGAMACWWLKRAQHRSFVPAAGVELSPGVLPSAASKSIVYFLISQSSCRDSRTALSNSADRVAILYHREFHDPLKYDPALTHATRQNFRNL